MSKANTPSFGDDNSDEYYSDYDDDEDNSRDTSIVQYSDYNTTNDKGDSSVQVYTQIESSIDDEESTAHKAARKMARFVNILFNNHIKYLLYKINPAACNSSYYEKVNTTLEKTERKLIWLATRSDSMEKVVKDLIKFYFDKIHSNGMYSIQSIDSSRQSGTDNIQAYAPIKGLNSSDAELYNKHKREVLSNVQDRLEQNITTNKSLRNTTNNGYGENTEIQVGSNFKDFVRGKLGGLRGYSCEGDDECIRLEQELHQDRAELKKQSATIEEKSKKLASMKKNLTTQRRTTEKNNLKDHRKSVKDNLMGEKISTNTIYNIESPPQDRHLDKRGYPHWIKTSYAVPDIHGKYSNYIMNFQKTGEDIYQYFIDKIDAIPTQSPDKDLIKTRATFNLNLLYEYMKYFWTEIEATKKINPPPIASSDMKSILDKIVSIKPTFDLSLGKTVSNNFKRVPDFELPS